MENGTIVEIDRIKRTGLIRDEFGEKVGFKLDAIRRTKKERKEWWNIIPLFPKEEVVFSRELSSNGILFAKSVTSKNKKYLDYSKLKRGMVLDGRIIEVTTNAIILDIGIREAPGIIYFVNSEMIVRVTQMANLRPGDCISLSILDVGNRHHRKIVYLAPKIDREFFFDWAVCYLDSCRNYEQCDYREHLRIVVNSATDLFKVKFYLNGLIENIGMNYIRGIIHLLSSQEKTALKNKLGWFRKLTLRFFFLKKT